MNLDDMRSRFAEVIGAGSSRISPDLADSYLNLAHQHLVPARLGWQHWRGSFDITLATTARTYDLGVEAVAAGAVQEASHVIAVFEPVIDVERDCELEFHSHPQSFWQRCAPADPTASQASPGRPSAALLEARRSMTFMPWPDSTYVIRIHAQLAPNSLVSEGIEDDALAMVVIAEAGCVYALERGRSETVARASALIDKLLPAVQIGSLANSHRPHGGALEDRGF